MCKRLMTIVTVVLGVTATSASSQGVPGQDEAFFRQHVSDIVSLQPMRLTDPAVARVFAIPVYQVKVITEQGGGSTSMQSIVVGRLADSLIVMGQPSEEGDYPAIQKLIRKDFKLTGPAAATTLQQALDHVYPMGSDEKARAFRRQGNEWTFVRGTFFDKLMGFVLTTDASGAVVAVKYSLKLLPA